VSSGIREVGLGGSMIAKLISASLLALWTSLPVPAVVAQQGAIAPRIGALDTTVSQRLTLRYQLYLPPGYAADTRRWPLLLFLHGAGERGADFAALARQVLPELAARRALPFILVAPQVPDGEIWTSPALAALLDRLATELRVDPDRVYLTGLSMGGFGAWELATAYPERFAAVVSISGGGNPVPACRLRDVSVWLVHGQQDDVIPVQESEVLARRLQACGGRVRLTVDSTAGHDAWTRIYSDSTFGTWLLAQRRHTRAR
jgi:predicted peptidase